MKTSAMLSGTTSVSVSAGDAKAASVAADRKAGDALKAASAAAGPKVVDGPKAAASAVTGPKVVDDPKAAASAATGEARASTARRS